MNKLINNNRPTLVLVALVLLYIVRKYIQSGIINNAKKSEVETMK